MSLLNVNVNLELKNPFVKIFGVKKSADQKKPAKVSRVYEDFILPDGRKISGPMADHLRSMSTMADAFAGEGESAKAIAATVGVKNPGPKNDGPNGGGPGGGNPAPESEKIDVETQEAIVAAVASTSGSEEEPKNEAVPGSAPETNDGSSGNNTENLIKGVAEAIDEAFIKKSEHPDAGSIPGPNFTPRKRKVRPVAVHRQAS